MTAGDLKDFDLRSMRQKIGVDLQNGKLFSGIFFHYHHRHPLGPGRHAEAGWQGNCRGYRGYAHGHDDHGEADGAAGSPAAGNSGF